MQLGETARRVATAAMAMGLGLSLAACADDDSGDEASGGCSSDSALGTTDDGASNADDNVSAAVEPATPEVTHASYMDKYGDQLEDIGTYYENSTLTLAVPEYVDIDSIEDLTGCADRFDGRIVGIEPGAGLTEITKESVMPEYDLDGDYELVTSSTTAMLAELEAAIEDEEDIVVTLWRPFWANDAYPVKDLEDLVVNEYGEGKEAQAARAWVEDHPDWVESVTA